MAKRPSQKVLEAKAWIPTLAGAAASLALLVLSYYSRADGACGGFHEICLGAPPAFALFAATGTYFLARSPAQEKLSSIIATIITTIILASFPDESKVIPFLAATKQFSMVLLAGAITLLFRSTLSSPEWQRRNNKISVALATVAFAYPFLAELFKWPCREGLSDVSAIFAASTFGAMYLKEKAEKRSLRRSKSK